MATQQQAHLLEVFNHADPEVRAAYQMIPQCFIDQIFGNSQGVAYEHCFLNADLVSNANYNSIGANTDFFRIQLLDGKTSGDIAYFKLRLAGKIDPATKAMVPMKKGALPDASVWLTNFRSGFYQVGPDNVQRGDFTQDEYETIFNYCHEWEQLVAQKVDMYRDSVQKNNRLSFIARNTAFLFTFDIQVRPNRNQNRKPTDPLWTPGIDVLGWSNVHLFKQTSGATASSINIVDSVAVAPVSNAIVTPVSVAMNPVAAGVRAPNFPS